MIVGEVPSNCLLIIIIIIIMLARLLITVLLIMLLEIIGEALWKWKWTIGFHKLWS